MYVCVCVCVVSVSVCVKCECVCVCFCVTQCGQMQQQPSTPTVSRWKRSE